MGVQSICTVRSFLVLCVKRAVRPVSDVIAHNFDTDFYFYKFKLILLSLFFLSNLNEGKINIYSFSSD